MAFGTFGALAPRLKPYDTRLAKLSNDDDLEVVRFMRHAPPVHYRMKIDSFSSITDTLKKNGHENVESTEYTVGAYTWVLLIYPDGNKEEKGDDHLSLTLRIVEKISPGKSVTVTFRFFIYDQIRDNYLVVQDLREKRFHAINNEWGISKVLPLSTFKDAANGFLINNNCVFGAEVFVLGGEAKTSKITMLKETTSRMYTWKVEKYSGSEDIIFSPPFTIEGRSWSLAVCPKGLRSEENKSVSLVLVLLDLSDLTNGKKLYVEYDLCLKNQEKGQDFVKSGRAWCSTGNSGGGYRAFLPLRDMENSNQGYKVNDVVIIEVNIKVLFLVEGM